MCDDPTDATVRSALLDCYAAILRDHGRSPLEALLIMAGALGAIYGSVAKAHQSPALCDCGWQPQPDADILQLQRNLRAYASPDPRILSDLLTAIPAGHG